MGESEASERARVSAGRFVHIRGLQPEEESRCRPAVGAADHHFIEQLQVWEQARISRTIAGGSRNLISVVGEYRVDRTAPSGVVVFEQLFGRGASATGDCEERVEKMCLILACGAAARPPMQSFPGNFKHFERDV